LGKFFMLSGGQKTGEKERAKKKRKKRKKREEREEKEKINHESAPPISPFYIRIRRWSYERHMIST